MTRHLKYPPNSASTANEGNLQCVQEVKCMDPRVIIQVDTWEETNEHTLCLYMYVHNLYLLRFHHEDLTQTGNRCPHRGRS